MTEREFLDFVSDQLEETFPKGRCQERGHALILVAELKRELTKRGLIVK